MNQVPVIHPTRDTDAGNGNGNQEQKLAKKIKNFIYDPNDVIGSGFSSKVYKGINELNNEQVAIKVIELSKIQNQVEKYLLNNEINALRALNHKNVLSTVDILMTKNNVYIVTEFCEFGDLQKMIKNSKKLNERDALNIARDVVEGYMAIEQKQIIHRDLKTANIFLTKGGAKIADFGFCEFMGQKKPQIAYNVGSPAYMSPESYRQNLYSNKSDIWGIGIILYEMLMGETPDKNLTYSQMSNNLTNGQINCGQNEKIKEILVQCFKRDIESRITSSDLYQQLTNEIKRLGVRNNQGGDSRYSSSQNRFGKGNFSSQLTPNHQRIEGKAFRSNLDNLRSSNDNINQRIGGQSPAKNNVVSRSGFGFEQGFQQQQASQLNEQNEIIIRTDLVGGGGSSGLINQYHQPSSLKHFESPEQRQQPQPPSPGDYSLKLKTYISILQFIFRLFKYLSDTNLSTVSFAKLLLFRHRSYIDQAAEECLESHKVVKSQSELYRQFQYLKMKFDEAYLDREAPSQDNSNHQLMKVMNQYANHSFTEHQSLRSYLELIRRVCLELKEEIEGSRSNAYILWDYLLLEYEMLGLYLRGQSDVDIVSKFILLEQILKEQPRNLGKSHIQLLKIKSQYVLRDPETQASEISDNPLKQQQQQFVPQANSKNVHRPNFIKF